ncbi:hypothetical protein B5M47_03775 [candidate division CPR3 bacterium 4484_211]|uniref:Hydrolase TatD n=1 Tax=candidate division CPR3 bacterium 4484_211 TaxID=1968527 RepID=A0A1W9NWY1_UNCC3|nr:MAG: hypothetical protein B5M47_03775 [candidate division CPR3 bacterium 4484_211]
MTDTHCHLNFQDFDVDRKEVIQRTLENLKGVITVGAGLGTSEKAVALAKKHKQIYAAVGLHPHNTEPKSSPGNSNHRSQVDELFKLARKSKKVIAIGETGLDYSPAPPGEVNRPKKEQFKLFIDQINLAKKLNLPLIIHCRDALDDTLSIIREQKVENAVFHCFTYDKESAKKVLEAGFLISFTGIVTFKSAHTVQETAKYVPLDKIMVETDAPFLAPQPFRGQRCEPWMVKYVVEKVAELKKISPTEVETITDRNARIFFKLET